MIKNKKFFGDIGEDIACNYLLENGYEILKRNYRGVGFEIDIIARDKREVIFVEVKSRNRRDFGRAAEAVNEMKQKRIIKGATSFLYERNLLNTKSRFDVIEVYLEEKEIVHIKDAFIIS